MNTKLLLFKSMALAILFFIGAIQLHAQQNYKLSDYVNPDYRYHSLDFTLDMNAYGSVMHSESDNLFLSKTNLSSFNENFNIAYYQIKNTALYQGTQSVSINSYGSWNKNFYDYHYTSSTDSYFYTSTGKRRTFDAGLNYSSTNRFYNSKKQFLEIIPDLTVDFQRDRDASTQDPMYYPFNSQNLSKTNALTFGLTVMVGMGRIENVENARLALYILNDLQKSGDVKKNLSNEQVDQLARFITKLRNKRFFDSRLQNIAEITSVDSLLTAMGIREHAGASYFMILNDDWNYANGPVRRSGHRFAFGVTPAYSNNLLELTHDTLLNSAALEASRTTSTNKTQISSLDFGAYYYKERPVNLTWQYTTRISLGYQLKKQVDDNSSDPVQYSNYKITVNNPNLHVSLERIYGYYPNSRTSLALDLVVGSRYEMQNQEDLGNLKSHVLLVYATAALSGNYYFSPQLRLNLNAGMNDTYRHFNNDIGTSMHILAHSNDWSPSINLSLRYSIF